MFGCPLRPKLASQMEHWNDFCLSWTVEICVFRLPLRVKLESQMEHLNGFFPSWYVAICLFRSPLWWKLKSQMENLNFCPSRTLLIYVHTCSGFHFVQILHLNYFCPSCTVLICFFMFPLLGKLFSITNGTLQMAYFPYELSQHVLSNDDFEQI